MFYVRHEQKPSVKEVHMNAFKNHVWDCMHDGLKERIVNALIVLINKENKKTVDKDSIMLETIELIKTFEMGDQKDKVNRFIKEHDTYNIHDIIKSDFSFTTCVLIFLLGLQGKSWHGKLNCKDEHTGLYPFMTGAVADHRSLKYVYDLAIESPTFMQKAEDIACSDSRKGNNTKRKCEEGNPRVKETTSMILTAYNVIFLAKK